MRCLQCGKSIPLLKRLGGSSEFCSEAHRREYQHEFSQLALGRLLQSQPAEFQAQAEKAPILRGASTPAVDQIPGTPANRTTAVSGTPIVNGTPASQKPSAAPAWNEMARPAATLAAPAAEPAEIAKLRPPQPISTIPAMNGVSQLANSQPVVSQPVVSQPVVSQPVVSQPATAPPATIQKPAPAALQFALVAAPEFEHAFASLAPGRPHRQTDMSPAELSHGLALVWDKAVEIANAITRPMESKLDLREMSRSTPRIALDLRIVAPECLEIESQPFTIAAELATPADAELWIGTCCDFAGEMASLSDFANAQFAKSDFQAPVLADGDVSDVAEPLPVEPQSAVMESGPPAASVESPTVAPSLNARIPDPELNPLPLNFAGVAPAKTKPLPVFGPAPITAGTIQIPQPGGLPLLPVMVLAAAAAPANPATQLGTDSPSPRPAAPITPELEPSAPSSSLSSSASSALSSSASSAPSSALSSSLSRAPSSALSSSLSRAPSSSPSSELNLGLPELRTPTPGEETSRMRKIIAAVAGVAVLGAGLYFFLGRQGETGSKSLAPASAVNAPGGQWIANFAPDAKRQRRVSVLRSSMNLAAYRLDFESSIQMKALGWVYRARDARNFYVSKIEFQKPGVNPVYALVHYAVIDGVEQPRVETPLPVSVPMGGLYKIRFEAVGNRFTTWVQGEQVEQWTDPRLSSGGAGLYGEGSEQSVLHGDFVVTPLQN